MGDVRKRVGEQRAISQKPAVAFEGLIARQRAHADLRTFRMFDTRQLAETIDVDQYGWPRQSKIHRRDQALPAGEKAGFVAMFGFQGKRVGERRSCNIFEWSRLHRSRSKTAPTSAWRVQRT